MGSVRRGQPLPLVPAGSVAVGPAAALVETDEGGAIFIWGMPVSSWGSADIVGRRLAAVSLATTGAARHGEVATAFGVEYETLRGWQRAWEANGCEGLRPQQRGPKGPSKLRPRWPSGFGRPGPRASRCRRLLRWWACRPTPCAGHWPTRRPSRRSRWRRGRAGSRAVGRSRLPRRREGPGPLRLLARGEPDDLRGGQPAVRRSAA